MTEMLETLSRGLPALGLSLLVFAVTALMR